MVPFECDTCIFRKLTSRISPEMKNPQDQLLLACIRRMNLDAFWSRETGTVNGQKDKLALAIKLSALVGLQGPCKHEGPLPAFDHCGYEAAIDMLLYSKRPGKTSQEHLEFDTVRKMRTAFSNQVRASPQATRETLALGDADGAYNRITADPCGSMWFYHFMAGMKSRMGQDWRPNKGLSTELLLKLLQDTESRIEGAPSVRDLDRWTTFHAYSVLAYTLSLRGGEAFFLDLSGLHEHWNEERSHLIITLQGKVKGESQERNHLLPCVHVTSSGIDVKASVQRLMTWKKKKGFTDGPAICDLKGHVLGGRDIDGCLHEVLLELFGSHRHMFPADIKNESMVKERYSFFRTYRRASDTRAAEVAVSGLDMDIVNRWATVEKAKGRRPNMAMKLHYAQYEQLLKPFLRYTGSM